VNDGNEVGLMPIVRRLTKGTALAIITSDIGLARTEVFACI
jgi:hypothetical protein